MLTRQTTRRRSAPAPAVPLGFANGNVDFFAHGACAQPGVDPSIFTSEEDNRQAVAAARAVCSGCPVCLPCRRYPTFAEVVVAAHLVDCSGCSTPSHGIAGLPGKRPRAAA